MGLLPAGANAQSSVGNSVQQYGITWYFSSSHQTGQYANGDWWVLGPVTITRITPESANVGGRIMHGTMLNPRGGSQGYDSHSSDMSYASSLNVAPSITGKPLQVSTGSVVSSISLASPNSTGRPLLRDLAILTVVADVPEQGAFRPHPYGTDKKSYWNEKRLDYTLLRSLAKVPATPDLNQVKQSVQRFWNEQDTNWTARAVHAANNQPMYGREMSNVMGRALLSLHLDYTNAQKRDLFVSVVQYGLDIYGRARAGGVWEDLGGHNHGRKGPLVLAGLALNDAQILAYADAAKHLIFQDDRQVWYVTQQDVGKYVVPPRETYRQADVGMPEWGAQHTRAGSRDDRRWGAGYRWVGGGLMYHGLAARLTRGGVQAWNHPAFFDYIDRYQRLGSPDPNGANAIESFVAQMWAAYRDLNTGGSPPPSAPLVLPNPPTSLTVY